MQSISNVYSAVLSGGKILHFAPEKGIEGRLRENPEYRTAEERFRLYGQKDHVRLYGNDIKHSLENMRFKVIKFTVKDDVLREEAVRMNLIAEDSAWVLEKRRTGIGES